MDPIGLYISNDISNAKAEAEERTKGSFSSEWVSGGGVGCEMKVVGSEKYI
jgi:hypothetical protein